MFQRRRAQERTDANCAARMKHAKLLLQKFPQYATDFVFLLRTKRCSRSLHLTIGRTKSVADCRNFLKHLFNITLCPAFLRKFVCQPVCCVPLEIQTFYQNLVLVAEYHVVVDEHYSDVCCDELLMPHIHCKSK